MARKGWTSLSAGYRSRLEKSGVTKRQYEQGASLQSARGHGKTPETHTAYSPTKYPTYHTNRENLIAQVEARKAELWGGGARWDAARAAQNLRSYPPTIAQLRWALHADDEEIQDAFGEAPEEYAWFGYH